MTHKDVVGPEKGEIDFPETMMVDGQSLRRHKNGGGWVPFVQDEFDYFQPYVAETVMVGPEAMVYGNARVTGKVNIIDRARVYGSANLRDNVVVKDDAQVCGIAYVSQDTVVAGKKRLTQGLFQGGTWEE